MELKRHHKIFIGSFTSLVIIYMIINSLFLYTLFVKTNINFNNISQEIQSMKTENQLKINELTSNLIQTKETLIMLNSSLKNELNELKASASSDFSGIIENVIPSVVTIRTDVAQGTGFIISDDGYLVTNAHVLNGAREVFAINSNQKTISANLIGYDATYDVALLKIQGNYLSLELADSNDVQVGEKVIAIGNPLGLQFSVSEGIVSAVHRAGTNGIQAYIQTDAALNPGNSGGPLINKEGEVIGINNFKLGGSESLGFALESNYIKRSVNVIYKASTNQTLLQ